MGSEKYIAMVAIGGTMAAAGGGYGLVFLFIGGATGVFPLIALGLVGGIVGIIGLVLLIMGAQTLMAPSPKYPKYPAYYPPPYQPYQQTKYQPRYDNEKKRYP